MQNLFSRIVRRLAPPRDVLSGYQHPELIDVIFRKTVAHEPGGEWPEMSEASTVLDFGGACGIHYKQARSGSVRWAVVETPAMVARASELTTDRLRFFTSIEEAVDWLGPVDVMHSNGALQYTPSPSLTLQQLCQVRAACMMWSRVHLSAEGGTDVQSSFLTSNGPGQLAVGPEKMVEYPRHALSETSFLDAHQNYRLEARGSDWFRFRR